MREIPMRFVFTLLATVALVLAQSARSVSVAAQAYPVSYHAFTFSAGAGTVVDRGGALAIGRNGYGTATYTDPHRAVAVSQTYDVGRWTSAVFATVFTFTELVSSWTAETPEGTF